jgi:hypothetical protein
MRALIKIILCLFISNVAIGQTVIIKEPEFANNAVYVNDSIGDGVLLEKQECTYKVNSNAVSWVPFVGLFAGKTTSKNVFQGKESPIKISNKDKVKFIIKVLDNTDDPASLICIFKLTQDKDTRIIITSEATTFGGAESKNLKTYPFIAKKYGQSSYQIELNNLETGQYGIQLKTSTSYLLFDIK